MNLIVDQPAIYLGAFPERPEQCTPGVRINLCEQVLVPRLEHQPVFQLTMRDDIDPTHLVERSVLERFLLAVHTVAADQPSWWHCREGINRSAFALAAYLYLHRGMRISSAIDCLRSQRSSLVLCNTLFEETLRAWYGGPDEQTFSRTRFTDFLSQRGKRQT